VRIAPNEVTFSSPEAWNDIFQHATGHPEFPKDPVWWRKQSDKPNTLPNAIDTKTHTRFRKALAPAFTPRALQSQEPILHRYVDLLVERLRELTQDSSTESVEVDMTSWFNFTAFDIFGDLGFGESFDCLQDSKYHPWISLLFNSVKAASFIAAARFYPIVEVILMKLIPASLKKMANDHYQQIVDKVHRRLNREIQRSDIMSHLIDKIGEDNGMTLDEVNATFGFLTTAGSETTATVLSGTLNYLIQNPEKMTILVRELREAFNTWDDITLENLGDLFYLNAVLNEGLRLCPPIPWILPRKVPAGGKVICGIWIPGGVSI
jgi:cytochrome P450